MLDPRPLQKKSGYHNGLAAIAMHGGVLKQLQSENELHRFSEGDSTGAQATILRGKTSWSYGEELVDRGSRQVPSLLNIGALVTRLGRWYQYNILPVSCRFEVLL